MKNSLYQTLLNSTMLHNYLLQNGKGVYVQSDSVFKQENENFIFSEALNMFSEERNVLETWVISNGTNVEMPYEVLEVCNTRIKELYEICDKINDIIININKEGD